jgi:hypothetical protein
LINTRERSQFNFARRIQIEGLVTASVPTLVDALCRRMSLFGSCLSGLIQRPASSLDVRLGALGCLRHFLSSFLFLLLALLGGWSTVEIIAAARPEYNEGAGKDNP